MSNMKTVPYDGMFTLSAPSPKWVWNAQGQLVEVPAGQPAWDHDPVTGEPLGQRLEGEATNLLLNSFTPATQAVSVSDATTYTLSVYGSGSAEITAGGSGTATDGSPLTFTTTGTSVTVTVTGTLDVFQLETGSAATSPIETTGSAVTRAADVATIENVDTAAWFDDQEFTIFWHYRIRTENIGTGSSSVSLCIRPDGPVGYDDAIGIYGNNRWYIYGLGNGFIGPIDSETKLAFSIKSDRTLIYANGTLLEEILGNAVINLQAAGRITVSLGRFQGELYDCRTFKRALTAAELQELTS